MELKRSKYPLSFDMHAARNGTIRCTHILVDVFILWVTLQVTLH